MAKQTFTTGQVLTAAQMQSLQQTAMGGGSPSTKTASYVLTAADAGTVIQMNSASATTITVNTSLFAAGDSVQIQNIGAGTMTITAGTATVNSAGTLGITQYDGGFLYFSSASSAIWFDYTQAGTTLPLTTKGDLFGFSTTNARIPVGANATVLTADSTEALGVKWAAPSGATASFVEIATSGTLSSGTSYTFSSISGYSKLYIKINGVSPDSSTYMQLRLNGDTTTKYFSAGWITTYTSSSNSNNLLGLTDSDSRFNLARTTTAGSYFSGALFLDGCNSTGIKMGWQIIGSSFANTNEAQTQGIYYTGTSTISSVTILTNGASFDAGSVTLFGSAA